MSGVNAVIVIPVHRPDLNENEKKSLAQCLKILGRYPVIFAVSEKLDITPYSNFCSTFAGANVSFTRFDDSYFQTYRGYNALLLKGQFYRRFKAFDFMLLYQLDAWVFYDGLEEWCKKGFDYIGSPWFIGQDKARPDADFMEFSGNGGFSLRDISACLKVIRTYKIIKSPAEVLKEYQHFGLLKYLIRIPIIFLRMLGLRNNTIYARAQFPIEDNYWAHAAPTVWPGFKVARAKEAIAFSFECMPARLYAMNNNHLPFGCHAWEKWDYDFWKQYIP